MLSDILKKHSNELLRPLGVFMGRIGIRPNNLTFLGLALTMAAAWQLHAAAILPGVALLSTVNPFSRVTFARRMSRPTGSGMKRSP